MAGQLRLFGPPPQLGMGPFGRSFLDRNLPFENFRMGSPNGPFFQWFEPFLGVQKNMKV